ncbi:MAG: N-6 DNA methylase [Gammaproteobacteria bacterium]|nr:N-6 DNA methylase [Gammaproteobacteria bacterium]
MNKTSLFGDTLDSPLKRFEDIHNYLYANDGLSEQQVLEEIVKILFLKYHDERNEVTNFYITEGELKQKNKNTFYKRINSLFESTKQKYKVFFDNNDQLELSLQSLVFVINKLQKIYFTGSTKDANGLAFQKFLCRHAKGGRGQFFTPDPVIDFCVEIIQPKPCETIIDPACGTGGFLFSSLNFIRRNFRNKNLKNYVENNIFGIEINRRISQIAKIKFLIEVNADPNILCSNALEDINNPGFPGIQKGNIENYCDIVLTNPPFGTQGKIVQKNLLSAYDLGYKWNKCGEDHIKSHQILKGQVPEILFIERCLKLLKPGGRAGIVLPNGHFENASLEYLRRYIKEKAHITGIVLLPQETFVPYGTGVKASLLFLQKKNGQATNGKQVFFSRIDNLGYAGNKNGTTIYKKDKHGKIIIENGEKLIDEDFTESIDDYNDFLQARPIKSEKSFLIDANQLNGRFDYNYYSPANRRLISDLKSLNAVRLEEIADIVKTKEHPLKQDMAVEYIELSDVYTKSFEIINTTTLLPSELPSRASYELKAGDIITAVAGNSIGTRKHATAYVTHEFDKAICTNGFRVLRNFKIDHFYLLYYLQSDLFLKQVFMYRTGAAIPALSDNDFSNILIYLPSEKEIKDIGLNVKKSFELRNEAKSTISSIKTKINIKHINNRCT